MRKPGPKAVVFHKNNREMGVEWLTEPLLRFQNFTFRYESQAEPTLHDIQCDIYPNEKILILGPSGSGKSTFGKVINGLIPEAYEGQVQGQVILRGAPLLGQSIGTLSREVGTVLQDTSAQFVGLTIAEDVAFALENDGVNHQVMHASVAQWMERLHLSHMGGHSPQDLSGGQKQRVSMAGVLIDQPQILLFDEPLANLDPQSGYETMALIDQLQRDLGSTVIIIEHRLEEVLTQSVDRIIVFDQGRIIYDGKPGPLLESDLLPQIGIRVPLYVSALKYAGVAMAEVQNLEHIEKVYHPSLANKLTDWIHQKTFAHPSKEDQVLLEIKDVAYTYPFQDQPALSGISTIIYEGEMISIVGTNGAGKTTLAKLIAGFLMPERGQLLWQGKDITTSSIRERANHIGYVMQDPNQMISQHLIFDEVALGLRLRGVDEATVKEKVYEALQVCGLYRFREWPINALSFGQKKRVTIAAILVLEPQLIILDEPTAGQDFRHYYEFMQFLARLNRQGVTILMITHDLQLMLEYTRRTLVVTNGTLVANLSPNAVLTSESLTQQASLRPTSLYTLAQRFGIDSPQAFVQYFIDYEREGMGHD